MLKCDEIHLRAAKGRDFTLETDCRKRSIRVDFLHKRMKSAEGIMLSYLTNTFERSEQRGVNS